MGISKADGFTIDKIQVNPLTLKASFQVTIPTGHVAGNYKISGTGWNKKVEGSGAITDDITNLVVSGNLQLGVVDHSIQLKTLDVDYSIDDLKINVDGLEIEGMTKEQINDLLNKQLLNHLRNDKPFICKHIEAKVIEVVNKILYGHTLAEVIAFDEKLVAS
ncbi:JHBP domain-containing protein, partial [Shewanella sp. A3A]|nr:JHBP domain-containing protein [Shewanella ferrihydritica]